MTRALSPARAAAFATAYALLTLIGRATATEGQVVSLIWPGSGVALLWLLAESPRHVLRVLVPLMAIHFGVVLATGVSPLLGFFGAASVTLQTAVTGLLLRRWCPTMLGAGGTASIRSPRNLAAMATEEMLRANPIDGVVLLGGCDKTIPALLMAAASVDLPAVVVPGGPMLTGTFRGTPLGCGTDVWRLSEEVRAGLLSRAKFLRSESSMIRSRGHCNTMGTASTMGLLAEALGTVLPGLAGTPAGLRGIVLSDIAD